MLKLKSKNLEFNVILSFRANENHYLVIPSETTEGSEVEESQ
jgi:hypothetical protein